MKNIFISLTISLYVSGAASVGFADTTKMKDVVSSFQGLRSAVGKAAGNDARCELTPNTSNCTFESQCGRLKASDPYVYADSEGRKIPNFAMISMVETAENCTTGQVSKPLIDDPFVYPLKFTTAKEAGSAAKLTQNREALKKNVVRAEAIFKDALNSIIEVLNSRRNAQNSVEIDNLIARAKRTGFKAFAPGNDSESLFRSGCEGPNAFYRPDDHEVTLCPQFMNLPEGAIFMILSHEIGHGIGPCYSAYDFSEYGLITPEWQSPLYSDEKPIISKISPEKQPLKNVLSCLQSAESINIKIPTKQAVLKRIDEEAIDILKLTSQARESGSTDATQLRLDERRQGIMDDYEKFKTCSEISGSGHAEEAMADWYASKAVAKKLGKIQDSAKAKEFAFATQASFLSMQCENSIQAAENAIRPVVGKSPSSCQYYYAMVKGMKGDSGQDSESHPRSSKRVNRVLLAEPAIKKAISCNGGDNAKACE